MLKSLLAFAFVLSACPALSQGSLTQNVVFISERFARIMCYHHSDTIWDKPSIVEILQVYLEDNISGYQQLSPQRKSSIGAYVLGYSTGVVTTELRLTGKCTLF